MLRLARWSTTHRWRVRLGWIAVVISVIALGRAAGTSYSNNFTLPHSDAQRVFLVSRIHERFARARESSRAVAEGLALTGRVVTAAAAIMVCVFLSFMLGEQRVIKGFGLSLASAGFLDALVVRCLLLPSLLHIVGGRTWRLPALLERLLPRVRIEGSTLPASEPAPELGELLGAPETTLRRGAKAAAGHAEG